MTGSNLVDRLDVSRETLECLRVFEVLLSRWNARINLVSRHNIKDIWVRHIVDSAQLWRLAPIGDIWADLGSGGGFPGLVIAIIAKEERPQTRVTLIESDNRKVAFLRTVAREVGLDCNILPKRIESALPQEADVISARALANLSTLLEYSERHLVNDGTALFPKGVTWQKELDEARRWWRFDVDVIDSQTMPGAAILKIKGASRV